MIEKKMPPVFTFQETCASQNPENDTFPNLGRPQLTSIAKILGVPNPDRLSKLQICRALAPLAHDLTHNRPRCENYQTTNLGGNLWEQIPPYLIYTIRMTRENDDTPPRQVVDGTFCSDLRDLVSQIEHNRHRAVIKHPIYTHIILTREMQKDIMARWEVLTDFGRNPPEERSLPPIDEALLLSQRITDFLQRLILPPYTVEEFRALDENTLKSFLDETTHYHIMNISQADISALVRAGLNVDTFIRFLNQKASLTGPDINTFRVILSKIIANDRNFLDNQRPIRPPTPPPPHPMLPTLYPSLTPMSVSHIPNFSSQEHERQMRKILALLAGSYVAGGAAVVGYNVYNNKRNAMKNKSMKRKNLRRKKK